MPKSRKIHAFVFSSFSLSSLAFIATSAYFLNLAPKTQLVKLKTQKNFSQNVEGGNLVNPETYFLLENIPNINVAGSAYENILANLASVAGTNAAKEELIEIIKNLQLFALIDRIKRENAPEVVKQFLEKLSGFDFSSEEEITGGADAISALVERLNGFTKGLSAKVDISGIGNSDPNGSPTNGARIVNLLSPPGENASKQINLESKYNTLVKVATINPNASTQGQDISFSFNYQSTDSNEAEKQGFLVIKNANHELINETNLTTLLRNHLIFGRWESEAATNADGTMNETFLKTFNNFVIARAADASGFEIFIRAQDGEKISNFRAISGLEYISSLGVLDSQLEIDSPIIASTGQIEAIPFFGTKTFSRPSRANDSQEGDTTLRVYLGQGATFSLPLFTKPSSENSYSESNLRRVQGDNGDLDLTLDYLKTDDINVANNIKVNPHTLKLPLHGIVNVADELALAKINVINGISRDNSFAEFNINFNNRILTFARGRSNPATGSVIYNNEIDLSPNRYSDLVFFRNPGLNSSINYFDAQALSAQRELDANRQARDALATVYRDWARPGLADAPLFSDQPLLLRVIQAQKENDAFSNIKINETETFETSGNDLYQLLKNNYDKERTILLQLGLIKELGDNLFVPLNPDRLDDSLDIVNNVLLTLAPTNFVEGPSGIISRVIAINENSALDQNAKKEATALVLGDLVRVIFNHLAQDLNDHFKDAYALRLVDFLEANTQLQQTINPDLVKVNEIDVLANGFNTSFIKRQEKIIIYSQDSSQAALKTVSNKGSAIASEYLKLIFKKNFGRFLYVNNNRANLATYDRFSKSADLIDTLANPPASASARDTTYLRHLLSIYDDLFSYLGKNFDSLVASSLETGKAFNLSALKTEDQSANSFEAWFEALNAAFQNNELDLPSPQDLNYETINLFTKNISQLRVRNLVAAANIHNAIVLRQKVESTSENTKPITEQERLALARTLVQALYKLNVLANFSLISGNNNPIAYINELVDDQDPIKQKELIEALINQLDLRRVLNFSSSDLQSTAALAASQVPLAFTISLFIIGALFSFGALGVLVASKKSLKTFSAKTLKMTLAAASAIGLILVAIAIASIFIII